jgi:hypothetical protein
VVRATVPIADTQRLTEAVRASTGAGERERVRGLDRRKQGEWKEREEEETREWRQRRRKRRRDRRERYGGRERL